jgi:UDP-GlcNAc:undecaprenyl-phosphate GlcNAc-1-phosphate transferase
MPRLWEKLPIAAALLGGGLVVAAVGLIDDLRELGPWSKLAVQTAVAIFLVLCGIRIGIFGDHVVLASVVTVLWIVAITNAFNLLDNMDGLSGGVAFITSLIFFVVAVQARQFFVAAFLLTVIGATGGFLVFNFPPASIFMGDTGSLFIGYLLAVSAVIFSAYKPSYPLFSVTVPALVFAVPLFDTISVIVVRLLKGRPPFAGDKSHFSHRLVAIGMTPRGALLTNYLMTFCTGIAATLLYQTNTLGAIIVFVQVLAVIAIIVMLETASQRTGP